MTTEHFSFELESILAASQAIAAEQAALAEREQALRAEREALAHARREAQAGQLAELESAREALDEEYTASIAAARDAHTAAHATLLEAQGAVQRTRKALAEVQAELSPNRSRAQEVSQAIALLGGRSAHSTSASGGHSRTTSDRPRLPRGAAARMILEAILTMPVGWRDVDVIRYFSESDGPVPADSTVYNKCKEYRDTGTIQV